MSAWKLTVELSRRAAEAALAAHESEADWDPDIVIGASEMDEQRPDDWVLEAWLPRKPTRADRAAVARLAGEDATVETARLPETDWLVESQNRVQPISAGPFHVHTPDHAPDPAAINFCIPASQAFGTGHHETTAGCLAMLAEMHRQGVVAGDIADIGTGTGLLGFAAMRLWPKALATASDNDPVCAPVVAENMRGNGVPAGGGHGELAMVIAEGMDHPLLQARAPYDLLIANILAKPLIDLAPDFAATMAPGGHLLMAGLLETQEAAVRRAARHAGFRLACSHVRGDWSILWLRKRRIG